MCTFKCLYCSLARKQFPKRKLESRSDGEETKEEEEEKGVEEKQESKRARVEDSPVQTGKINSSPEQSPQ